MSRSGARSDGLRLTKVGLWFLAFLAVVVVAAANTGNNGLYLVLAIMAGVVIASQLVAAWNVRGLDVAVTAPDEVFAQHPARLAATVRNRSFVLPRWLLVTVVEPEDVEPAVRARRSTALLAGRVDRRASADGEIELLLRRRGLRRIRHAHVSSLFPFGLFRKGIRYPVDLELLVYPELFPAAVSHPEQSGRSGEESSRRPGSSHELLGLRAFRPGDDPRGVHWKQSARTGDLIYKVREADESRRLAVVLDNGVGELRDEGDRQRFERLVSEAASAAVEYLARGYEVELVTRDAVVPFGGGGVQRRRVLDHLALVEPVPPARQALEPSDPRHPHLLLAMEAPRAA